MNSKRTVGAKLVTKSVQYFPSGMKQKKKERKKSLCLVINTHLLTVEFLLVLSAGSAGFAKPEG